MSKMAVFRWGVRLGVTLFSFVAAVELCVRLEDAVRYGAPLWGSYDAERLRKNDADGDPWNVPGARFQKWRNNGFGFRGEEMAARKRPGTARVFCFGASESYGLYESPGKEWPAQLAEMLPKERFEVINCSVAGLVLKAYPKYAKEHVLALEPDVVVCYINPYFAVSFFDRMQREGGRSRRKKAGSRTDGFQLRMTARLKDVFKGSLASWCPKALQRYQVWHTGRMVEAERRARGLSGRPRDEVSDAAVADFRRDLESFIALLQSRHIDVVLATYPSLKGPGNDSRYPEIFLDAQRFVPGYSFAGLEAIPRRCNAVISETASRRQLPLVDCQGLVPKSTEYFSDNVHYTDRGAGLVARAVATQIAEGGATSVARAFTRPAPARESFQ